MIEVFQGDNHKKIITNFDIQCKKKSKINLKKYYFIYEINSIASKFHISVEYILKLI